MMRCWRCDDRDERNDLGLCRECDDELHQQHTIPPGRDLHPKGTLPEDIGTYYPPHPDVYKTIPQGMPVEVTQTAVDGPIQAIHITTAVGTTFVYNYTTTGGYHPLIRESPTEP
jgi:hypothetical protein